MNHGPALLYFDANYVIALKPQGLVSHMTLDKGRSHFFKWVQEEIEKKDPPQNLGLHHRLDRDTSGLMLFSRNHSAAKVIDSLFKERKINKVYQAIVQGYFPHKKGEWKNGVSLIKKKEGEGLQVFSELKGDLAHMSYEVLEEFKDTLRPFSLVRFVLYTGRRHQIRAQSAFYGHPLYGDLFYGGEKGPNNSSFYLHCEELSFFDPLSQKTIAIKSPPPFNFLKIVSSQQEKSKEVIAFYKPFGVLTQFSGEEKNLSEYQLPSGFYPAGRLDKDSEGLLILSDDGDLIQKISAPSFLKRKHYWVQIERIPNLELLKKLEKGILIEDYITKKCQVRFLKEEEVHMIPPRTPPIRFRKMVPDCWIEIILSEGKNRQVRKMTAKIGHPTLRLLRVQIGDFVLYQGPKWKLQPGEWIKIKADTI